jgi:hypothetical protein
MKINKHDLKNIIYALTLADRAPEKKFIWLSRGFRFFNRNPGSLFLYWQNRLLKNNNKDILLYKQTLKKFKKAEKERAEKQRKIEEDMAQEYPSAKEMISSASSSIARWINSGLDLASREVVEKRRQICILCPFWDSMALNSTGRCKKCGCSTWAKIKLATESCPEKKW